MNDNSVDPDEVLKPIRFKLQERDLILDLYSLDPELEERFNLAVVEGGGVIVNLNAYDLDQLMGEIAAVANHEENAGLRRKLDALFDRVDKKMQKAFPRGDS